MTKKVITFKLIAGKKVGRVTQLRFADEKMNKPTEQRY